MAPVEQSHRFERKFIVPPEGRCALDIAIRFNPALFAPLHHPRTVHNIYLDSPALRLYFLNGDGVTERTKVRIRWYGADSGTLPQPILEFKMKQGLLGWKESFRLQPFCLDNTFCGAALQEVFHESKLPPEVMRRLGGLEPSLLNSYHRSYFKSADGRYRITRDSGLKFHRIGPGHNALLCRVAHLPVQVLELKYEATDEDGADDVAGGFPFRVSKFSKYALGVELLNGY